MRRKTRERKTKIFYKTPKKWFFIGYEYQNGDDKFQITRNELKGLNEDDRTFLIQSIVYMKHLDIDNVKDHKSYESYHSIYPKLGRFRFEQFRVYTYSICEKYFLILHIIKKKKDSLSQEIKEKIVKRAKFYENNLETDYRKRYCK